MKIVYALLKSTPTGSQYHGCTTSWEAADAWDAGSEGNWHADHQAADDGSIIDVSLTAYDLEANVDAEEEAA